MGSDAVRAGECSSNFLQVGGEGFRRTGLCSLLCRRFLHRVQDGGRAPEELGVSAGPMQGKQHTLETEEISISDETSGVAGSHHLGSRHQAQPREGGGDQQDGAAE